MESNQDQALMRGPPDHRANGPDIPLSGYVVSFSALLTCLSPRNSVRTCALARVEGSVPPTSGFGIRRSPLSYTRILFERVRICTSQRGSIGRVYLTTRPPGLPPSVSPYQSASTLFRHRSMVPPPASCGEERHICASRLDCHTVLGGPCTGKHGSFQQDSAGSYRPTQASGFRMGATQYSRWTELHSLGATLLLAPACWRIPSLHAPPGAAALQVSAHSVAVIVPPLPPP